jgi:DNA (cytosine-5)-methyltransferase 1
MPDDTIPILSLFCGAGGLDWGFRREHFRIILACDNSVAAVNSYNLNTRSKVARLADLSVLSPRQIIDLMEQTTTGVVPEGIIGGPPCQGFSVGNARADPNDLRNLLPFKYAEILAAFNESYNIKFFVFENVMGLMTSRHIERFRAIQKEFENAGFTIFCQDLNAVSFGVPQNRRRLFVVGLNSRLFPRVTFKFPKGRGKPRCVRDAIYGLPVPAFFTRGMTSREIPYHPNHWTMMPKSPKLSAETSTDGITPVRKLLNYHK